jgi:phosphoserine phosphatase
MNPELMMKDDDDMSMLKSMTDHELIYYTFLEIKTLKKRMEAHSAERQEFSRNIYSKLDELKEEQSKDKIELLEKIRSVELSYVRDDKSTNTKIAAISGSLSLVVAVVTAWIISIIKGER